MGVFLGSLLVVFHNIRRADWTVPITLLGRIGLAKGALLLALPKCMEKLSRSILKGPFLEAFPFTALALGLVFGYFWFLA